MFSSDLLKQQPFQFYGYVLKFDVIVAERTGNTLYSECDFSRDHMR